MKKAKKVRYNFYLKVYAVEYSEVSEGYEPKLMTPELVRYNFILPGNLHPKYIKHQIRGFVKALENGVSNFSEEN